MGMCSGGWMYVCVCVCMCAELELSQCHQFVTSPEVGEVVRRGEGGGAQCYYF